MKKFSVLMFLFISISSFLVAQNTGITSIFYDSSFGIFDNELDWAVNVGSDFTGLKHDYIFGGLTNLEKKSLSTNTSFDNGGGTLWGGYYKSGDDPWSIFSGFTASDSSGNQSGGTTYTAGAATTDGTTTWQWDQVVTDTNYTANRIFDSLGFAGQYLFMLNGFNTGVYLGISIIDSSTQANNYEETQNWYYNSTGAAVAPTPLLDFTRKITKTAYSRNSTYTLGVPLYMEAGEISHTINTVLYVSHNNSSSSTVDTCTAPADATRNITNTIKNETTDTDTFIGLSGDYLYTQPGIWGSNGDNELFVSAGFSGNIDMPSYSTALTTQAVSYAGGGAAGVNGTRNDDSESRDFKSGVDFSIFAGAGHSFYYDIDSAVNFAIKPYVSLEFSMDNDTLLDSKVTIDRQDNDSDGAFTSAADRIITTTTTYTNTTKYSSNNTPYIDISTTIDFPVAATISPEKWPFYITLGSRAEIGIVNTINFTKTAVNSVHTVTVDGTGTTVSDTTVQAVSSDETSVVNTSVSIAANHNIGLTMPIGDYTKLDISLDMSSAMNILDFKDLTAQVIIALP